MSTAFWKSDRFITVAKWVLRVLLALAFGAAGVMKLTGQPMMVAEFDLLGLGQWFRYVTGAIEVLSALLILWPATVFWGALGLCGVCAGAFISQIRPLHGDVIHVIVLGLLAALAAWLYRPAQFRMP